MTKLICFPFIGDSIGGAHLSAIELIKRLDRTHYQPIVVLHEQGPLAGYFHDQNIDYFHLPLNSYAGSRPSLFLILKSAIENVPVLRRFIIQKDIKITHCNDLRTNMTWLLACRLSKVPFVWHQRTQTNSHSNLWKLIPFLASYCIAISHTTLKPMGTPGPRLGVFENPIAIEGYWDRASARAALIAEVGASHDDYLIGYVGRLTQNKRPDLCIELLAKIKDRTKLPLRLLIFGQGKDPFVTSLMSLSISRGLKERVHFMGFRSPISETMAALDVLIAPSEKEGFGRTLIEAMLVGTPVIASKIDAHCETIKNGKNGLLVNVGDVNSFAEAAQSLFQDRFKADMLAKEAKKTMIGRYSPVNHVKQIQQIYRSLL